MHFSLFGGTLQGAHLKHTEYRIWKKCMTSFITSLDPRLLGRKSKHKPPKSWNYGPVKIQRCPIQNN
uniref:Uncharacterized protein n=1 Tax=Zea mays TaxID=4577 RepID=C4IZY3_MAIZE|nr:unknown [Zea mays]